MNPRKSTQKSAKSTTAVGKKFKGFTDEERAAMKEHIQELKAAARRGPRADKAEEESAVLAKIAANPLNFLPTAVELLADFCVDFLGFIETSSYKLGLDGFVFG